MPKDPENIEDLDLSALDDGDDGAADEPEIEEETEAEEPEGDEAEAAEGADDPAGDVSGAPKDEIFEALVASGKLKEAEKYVALQEQQRAAQDKPEKVDDAAGLTDEDLGFGEEAEQVLNAAGYRQKMIEQQKIFNEQKVAKVIEKGHKLAARYQRAVEASGADSDEARELLEDYEEVRQLSIQAQKINQIASAAIQKIEGVERLVEKVPALRKYTKAMVNLVDQGIFDPFAPADEVRAVLKQHLPKAAAKPAAGKPAGKPVGKNQPDPEAVRALRQRLGSTRGSAGGGASGGQDGDRRARPASNGNGRAPKVSRETQAAYDRIAGRTRK